MIFRALAATLVAALLWYLAMPVLHPGYPGFWLSLIFIGAVSLIPAREDQWPVRAGLGLLAVVLFIVIGVGVSWAPFHVAAYRAQLGPETDGQFTDALPPIDLRQAPLVSEDMARRSAEKQLASVPALGSQVELGEFQKQLINGRLYWVAFLQHSSFFKWWNTHATPGYVRVSAEDPTDVALVTQIHGQPMALRYLPSAFFGDNLERHLYTHGYAHKGVASITPEVDESGTPYYVVTFYRYTVGFEGAEASSVAIVDPQTGAITPYALNQVPAWADIVQPARFVASQIKNRAYLIHGWINPSDKDRLDITGSPDLVYGADHRAYWYVGLTSAGNDNGLVGFYLVDSRTKAVRRFELAGATEDVAEKAAEGVIPEKHYQATQALPFVVDGKPTYVFSLRDNSGIPRAFAMVNIQTFQTLAVGDTLVGTLRQYEAALSRDPSATGNVTSQVNAQYLAGTITRIAAVVRQGNTTYVLSLDTLPGHVLVGSSDLSEALPLARPNDSVEVTLQTNKQSLVYNLTSFTDAAVLPQEPVNQP